MCLLKRGVCLTKIKNLQEVADYRRCPTEEVQLLMAKLAGCWPSCFCVFLFTETKSRSIKMQKKEKEKKNDANIQPS